MLRYASAIVVNFVPFGAVDVFLASRSDVGRLIRDVFLHTFTGYATNPVQLYAFQIVDHNTRDTKCVFVSAPEFAIFEITTIGIVILLPALVKRG